MDFARGIVLFIVDWHVQFMQGAERGHDSAKLFGNSSDAGAQHDIPRICPVIVHELQNLVTQSEQRPRSTSTSLETSAVQENAFDVRDIINHPANSTLSMYVSFAVNCQRRTIREEELREERVAGGGRGDDTMLPFIPEPGLPSLQDIPGKDASAWILDGQPPHSKDHNPMRSRTW
jgi:hypothetical protein